MRRAAALPLALLALLAGCATAGADRGLVDNPVYRAWGPPGWDVEIGDDIALRLGHGFFGEDIVSVDYTYPRVPAREYNGIRRWRTQTRGGSWIIIEARPGPCTSPGGAVYPETVRVVTRRHNLSGCGSPSLRGAQS